jgi:uncharacterized protein
MGQKFEFDDAKSAANKEKHGIDFVEAQRLWADDNLLIVPTRFVGEDRWFAIGRIDERVWTAVITMREDAVRIISVRRSRDDEQQNYYGS